MKAGWEVKPLGEVCTLQRGFDLPKRLRTTGPFPLVTSNGPTDTHGIAKVTGPGVTTGRSGTIGAVYFIESDFWPLNTALYVKDFHGNDEKYVWYLLQAFDLSQFASGAGVPTLNRNHVHGEKVTTTVSLEEQKRIVAVLDAAFEGLTRATEHAEANLQNARELFDAQVSSEFSKLKTEFGSKRIGDIAEHRLGKMLDKNKNRGEPRNYLRNKNVQWFEIDTSDLLEMRIEEAEIAKYSVEKGDLLICEGGYPGRAAIWNEDEPIFFQKALHRVRFEEQVYNRLLLYWLYLLDQTGQLAEHCSGAGIQHFTGKSLAKFEMPYPSADAASKAVKLIEATKQQSEDLSAHYRTKLTDIANLRQSLLQKAFAGALT